MALLRRLARGATPPGLVTLWNRARGRAGAELWTIDAWDEEPSLGWDDPQVVLTQRARFLDFRQSLESPLPIAQPPEADTGRVDPTTQHLFLAFAYALTRARTGTGPTSVLDWGGGLGQYRLVAQSLFPEATFEYTCKDLPHLAAAGRDASPDVRFVCDEAELQGACFDLVFASGSLQYSENWRSTLTTLARSATNWMYLTRLPVVTGVDSFIVAQSARAHSYPVTYPGWVLERSSLLEASASEGFALEREFHFGPFPRVAGAPEQPTLRGFLFRRS